MKKFNESINEVITHMNNHWVIYSALSFSVISILCLNVTVAFFESYNLRAFNYVDVNDIYSIALENLSYKLLFLAATCIFSIVLFTYYLFVTNGFSIIKMGKLILIILIAVLTNVGLMYLVTSKGVDINFSTKHKFLLRNNTNIQCATIITSPTDSVVIFNHTTGEFESLNKSHIVKTTQIYGEYRTSSADRLKFHGRSSGQILIVDFKKIASYQEWVTQLPKSCKLHEFKRV